jgi:uncharacterized protein
MTGEQASVDSRGPSSEDPLAASLRGFGPIGILAILIILSGNFLFPPLSALLVLAWVLRTHTPWRDIGYVRPASWTRTIFVAVIFGVAFKFLMKAVVMPLLGAPPVNQPYHFLAGNPAAAPGFLFLFTIGAGFGEETVFRGYMFDRLGRLFGRRTGAKVATVLLTSTVFALAHYSVQGLPGTEQAMISGLVFGTLYAMTGRIAMLMVAHSAFDLTAYAMIYWSLETRVAHLVFK